MSSSDIAVSIHGLSKAYTITHDSAKHVTLAETILHRLRHPFQQSESETFWALRDVSLDVKTGAVVGIIGRNGAGKSTLLKILSRITEPTSGQIELYGRVGSLLEVGTGFHPQLTGRENIFLNGAILGMSNAEIRKQFDAIVDFAGVEKFLDTPVKRYSSGMYMRLAFAVAAHLETEILIVDEVLSVGDIEFQRKCLGKMKDVARGGRTVVFVSHQMQSLRALCDTGFYMESGRCSHHGPIEECIERYLNSFKVSTDRVVDPSRRPGSGEHRFISVSPSKEFYECGEPKTIHFAIRRFKPFVGKVHVSCLLYDEAGNTLLHLDSRMVGHWFDSAETSTGQLTINTPWLKPGRYRLDFLICSAGIQDKYEAACHLQVVPLLPYPSGFANPDAMAYGFVFADYAYQSDPVADAPAAEAPKLETQDEQFNRRLLSRWMSSPSVFPPSWSIRANIMSPYDSLITTVKEIAILRSIGSVLGWDERTNMPPGGAELRSEQSSMIATMVHAKFTSPKIGEELASASASDLVKDPQSDAAVNVREIHRMYTRACKMPADLVQELARIEVLSEHAWADAKKKSDFPAFQPWLEKMIALKQREAACVGEPGKPYDALLDEFEPGETADNLRRVFESLRGPLVELVGRIVSSGKSAPADILERNYPVDAQQSFARAAAAAVGFDFQSGRLDVSVHPFSTGIGPGDSRITTRYDANYFSDAFFGTLHESGHAMYSQGLPKEHFGTPRGRNLLFGIHESQSRMWENLVGRSRSFWKFFFPKAQAAFPQALAGLTPEQWYFAINDVRPSLIRTESDEATYNLHVLLRFELEQALLTGQIKVADLPGEWNKKMKQYLGITPPDDARGCLQDVHWAGGAIGYFPTYTLGNLYAAQFFDQAKKDIGDLDSQFSRGDFAPLLGWLRKNIHSQGMKYPAPDLVKRLTGKPLSAEPLLNHLKRKAAELYGV